MAEFYAVLDIHKLHSQGNLSHQEAHNNREYPMHHVDDKLTYLDKEIISTGGLSYRDRWKEIIDETEIKIGKPVKVRRNAVLAFDIVTAFSPNAQKELNIDIDEWCEANKQWFIEIFGEDNIIAMTLHMDETDEMPGGGYRGPHIHTQVVPINEQGRLCARDFTGTRTMLKQLHNSYSEAMKQFGLSRGEHNSKLEHTSRKRWYHTVDTLANMQAPRPKDGETMEQYFGRVDTTFQDVNLRAQKSIDKAEKKFQQSETRQAQIFGEYAYSINLQHILEEGYGGDMTLVNERLKKYQILEKSVPRTKLDAMIDKMIEKYPPENNLSFYRRGKKKKHKKWESIPDVMPTDTTTSGTAPIMEDYKEELPDEYKAAMEEEEAYVESLLHKNEGVKEEPTTPSDDILFKGLGNDDIPAFIDEESGGITNVFGETIE